MDQYIYIGAALVIALLIGFIIFSIRWLNKTMLRNVRSHTLDLLNVYDELLEERSRSLAQEEEALRLKQEKAAQLEEKKGEQLFQLPQDSVSTATLLAVADRSAEAAYRDRSIGTTYHQIRNNFSFRVQEILPAMAEQAGETGGPAGRLLEELTHETVYALSTLREEEQLEVLSTSLSGEAISLLNTYLESHPRFNIFGFYDYLKSRQDEEPQEIRLYVPQGTVIPESGAVKISVDQEICEGFQVEMSGKLYDYCIKTKELS